MGVTAITSQILLMRELVVVFYGNELSLGIMLGVWLFWTAIGSSILSKVLGKRDNGRFIIVLQNILAILLPGLVILIRASKHIIGATPGEMMGFVPMLGIIFTVLAPLCLANGILYVLACGYLNLGSTDTQHTPGLVYFLEAVGAGVGGFILSIILLKIASPATIILCISSAYWLSALLVAYSGGYHKKFTTLFTGVWIIFIVGFWTSAIPSRFQKLLDRIVWLDYNLIETRESIYGNIAVTRLGEQVSFFQNGLLIVTAPDPMTAEESVHFALLEHPAPKNVALVGGGLNGSISEALRHPTVERLDYVELDPVIIALARKHLPENVARSLDDSRVQVHLQDGRRFLKQVHEKYDAIIINLPNPYTAQLNRFYTVEFFHEARSRLNDEGIISIQLSSSENAIGPELSDFLSTIATTLQSVFPAAVYLPGETARFIASSQEGGLTHDPAILVQRLHERELNTQYVREYYIPYQLSEERMAYLRKRLHAVEKRGLNRDFKPVGYHFDTILWATFFSNGFKPIYLWVSRWSLGAWLIVSAVIFLCIWSVYWTAHRRSKLFNHAILVSVGVIGFTEITCEIIVILAFQVLYGFAYQQLALIVAGYMLGLAAGSRLAISKNKTFDLSYKKFRQLQVAMTAYPIFLYCLLYIMQRSVLVVLAGFQWLLPLVLAGAGLIGGYQFPLANRLYLYRATSIKSNVGFIYGFDLLGSALGALFVSAFFIPILGIYETLILLVFLNALATILVTISPSSQQQLGSI